MCVAVVDSCVPRGGPRLAAPVAVVPVAADLALAAVVDLAPLQILLSRQI